MPNSAIIRSKIERARSGEPLRALDLFSGCGGISVGLRLAGIDLIGGLDANPTALATYFLNLSSEGSKASERPAWDLTEATPESIQDAIGWPDLGTHVDLLVGGPPCQAYSRIGRQKLGSLAGVQDAHLSDDRGQLYESFLSWVGKLNPLAVLIENVPDSLNYGGVNIPEVICTALSELGYESSYTMLNSAHYGVPQLRERVFIIGLHRLLSTTPTFPAPTHGELDPGTKRQTRSRMYSIVDRLSEKGLRRIPHAVHPPQSTSRLLPAVTVEDALSDLPRILTKGRPKPGCREVSDLLPYGTLPANPFQELMRTWPGLETRDHVTGNVVRRTPRDYPIFSRMMEGDTYLDANRIAEGIFDETLAEWMKERGRTPTLEELRTIRKSVVPPYSTDKFTTKWWKLSRDQPSHTVVAHLSVDGYSHIHYDPEQARSITVREAARLQSFPDGFRFFGLMGDAFQQIGNAVPPLLAFHLGRSIRESVDGTRP